MIKIMDRIKSIIYRILRSDSPNGYNICQCCKKRRKNWAELIFKREALIGYDKVLCEWVMFSEHNVYAKVWVINGYIVKVYTLNNDLWKNICHLCRCCITEYLKDYKEKNEDSEI